MDALQTIEAWAAQKGTADWLFNVAKTITPGWAIGREVTEADFDAAILRSGGMQILST